MRHLIGLALLSILVTACNVSSISTRLDKDLGGDNTVIVAVPNKDDCPSLLTATRPTIEENLKTLQTKENNNGTKMVFGTYFEGGLTGFRIVYPFNTPSVIPIQLENVRSVMSIPKHIQFPTISIPQPIQDQYNTTFNVTVKINPSQLLLGGNCSPDRMTYALTMPGIITSYSPNTNQPNLSVQKTGDTTVEWTLEKTDQTFTLKALSSINTGTPPQPTPSPSPITTITPYVVFITAVIGLIIAIIRWRQSRTSRGDG